LLLIRRPEGGSLPPRPTAPASRSYAGDCGWSATVRAAQRPLRAAEPGCARSRGTGVLPPPLFYGS
jgi:hypothetical protein